MIIEHQSNISIGSIYRTLSGSTNLGYSELGSNGYEGVLRNPQIFNITGTSPSDCLVSYTGHLLGVGSYPSAEMQSVYFTAPADWATIASWRIVAFSLVCRMQTTSSKIRTLVVVSIS